MPMMVQFLPWADLKRDLNVGPITFWPFTAANRAKIADPAIRDHLERYLATYVDQRGTAVKTVAVANTGQLDFRDLSLQEQKQVRAACDVLIFSVIYPQTASGVQAKNGTMGPPSADRYQLMTQCFTPGKDDIAIVAGTLMSSGWKIGEVKFPKPWCMGGPFSSPDKDFLDGFSRILDLGFDTSVRGRLVRSLEWFRLAHTEVDEVSPFSKVVMMATAFEILLDVPNVSRKADWIAERVGQLCGSPDSTNDTRKVYGKDVTRPKVAWWAWDFYKLRNSVVHGDDVQPEQLLFSVSDADLKWLTQLIVADLLFGELIIWKLEEQRCLGNEADEFVAAINAIATDDSEGLSREAGVRFVRDLNALHRALEWQLPLAREQDGSTQ